MKRSVNISLFILIILILSGLSLAKTLAPETEPDSKFCSQGVGYFKAEPKLSNPSYGQVFQTKGTNQEYLVKIFDESDLLVNIHQLLDDGKMNDFEENDGVFTIRVNGLNNGKYTAKLFSLENDAECSLSAETMFEIGDIECLPLFEKINNNKKRVDVIFFGVNYDSADDFVEVARQYISYDGIPDRLSNNEISPYSFGLFDVEPFRSNKDKFNFYYVPHLFSVIDKNELKDLFSMDQDIVDKDGVFPFCNLNYALPMYLATGFGEDNNGQREPFRSNALAPSFKNEQEIDASNLKFGNALILSPPTSETPPFRNTFIHEFGHAFASLKDEYGESGRNNHGYPNCAETVEEANLWWGDLIGEVDPFFYEIADLYEEATGVAINEDRYRISIVQSGCGDPSNILYKPSEVSVMNSFTSPIFGSVNRRRIEQVLSIFDEPVDDPEPDDETTPEDRFCEDSDNGLNYFIKGTTSNENGLEETDYCYNINSVKEYYCSENLINSRINECDFGCDEGICKDKPKLIFPKGDFDDNLEEKIRGLIDKNIKLNFVGNIIINFDEDENYVIEVRVKSKLFGIFPVVEPRTFVLTKTGKIIDENHSWWGFLAKDY